MVLLVGHVDEPEPVVRIAKVGRDPNRLLVVLHGGLLVLRGDALARVVVAQAIVDVGVAGLHTEQALEQLGGVALVAVGEHHVCQIVVGHLFTG